MKEYWDKVAQNKNYYWGDNESVARKLLLKIIKDGESLLDVGCGNGFTYQHFLNNKRQIFYKGIDFSDKMIQNCQERWKDNTYFERFDANELTKLPKEYDLIKEYDTIYFRHSFESVEDWREVLKQAFQLAKKRVVIDFRRPFINTESEKLFSKTEEGVFCWDINYDEFNILCRNLTVNVSYLLQDIGQETSFSSGFVIIGKKLDDIVFTLDDFHETNHRLDLLLELKDRFPKMKVTLFTIPSKCSINWLKELKDKYGDWMEFAVHGWFHNVSNRENDGSLYPEECKNWSKEDAHKYLQMAEEMGVFIKGFKAPGWQMNVETYEVLKDRGYWIMDHANYKHIRPEGFNNYYETGHLWEVNGHIQPCNFNGLEELATTKCNFQKDSSFYFVSEMMNTDKNKIRLQDIYESIKETNKM